MSNATSLPNKEATSLPKEATMVVSSSSNLSRWEEKRKDGMRSKNKSLVCGARGLVWQKGSSCFTTLFSIKNALLDSWALACCSDPEPAALDEEQKTLAEQKATESGMTQTSEQELLEEKLDEVLGMATLGWFASLMIQNLQLKARRFWLKNKKQWSTKRQMNGALALSTLPPKHFN